MSRSKKPESWARTELGTISNYINGRAFKSNEWGKEGLPIIRIQNLTNKREGTELNYYNGEYDKKIFITKGDLLFCWSGTLSVIRYTGENALLNQHIFKVEVNSNILSNFYFYQLKFLISRIYEEAHGVGLVHITKEKLLKIPFLLPPPLEQRRITDKIESCFLKINLTETILKKIELYLIKLRESILVSALTGKLIKENASESAESFLREIENEKMTLTSGKNKEAVGLSSTTNEEIPYELPDGWCWTKLGYLKTYSIYGPRFSSEDYSDKGVPVLRTTDIDEFGKVNTLTAPKLNLSKSEIEKYKLHYRDILITRTGSIGTLSIFEDSIDAIAGAYLIQYRVAKAELLAKWVLKVLESPYGQEQLNKGKRGAGIPNVNVPTIDDILIPLPPKSLIPKILSKVDEFNRSLHSFDMSLRSKLTVMSKLKESVLKEAFEGRLVDQIQSEGSGHELLAKIQVEKENLCKNDFAPRAKKSTIKRDPAKKSVMIKGKKNGKK